MRVRRGANLRKEIDYETEFWCAGGISILREEVWVDDANVVIRYNLALLLPHCFGPDNGRVLGFDKAHGVHERHFLGEVRPSASKTIWRRRSAFIEKRKG
jgi:hypothetical protein